MTVADVDEVVRGVSQETARRHAPPIPFGSQLQKVETGERVPSGAVYLRPEQVLDLQSKIIERWRPRSEVWPFTYGLGVIGTAAATSGVVFQNGFLRHFKLLHKGTFVTMLPAVVIPCIVSMGVHYSFVTRNILLQEFNCPMCAEIRAASLQLVLGYGQPFLLGLFSSALLAKQFHTFAVPSLMDRASWGRILPKLFMRIRGPATSLFTLNVVSALLVTNYQVKYVGKINNRLAEELGARR